MTETNRLQEQVKVVARARVQEDALTAQKKKSYEAWLEGCQELLYHLEGASSTRQEAEGRLRELTLQAYAETGNKQPAEGVGVRETTKLEYDPQVALLWATDHRIMLKLDTPAFEKYAKASPLEFVKTRGEAQATIAQDLSKYIEA